MKKQLVTLIAALALAPASWALSFDQNVNTPGPGVFMGSGIANGYWTVGTANGIELGLRTHERYQSLANQTPSNTTNSAGNGNYNWADQLGYVGAQNRSSWNYDFSLNVAGTAYNLSDFTFKMWVDSDAGAGHTWSVFDPSLAVNALSGSDYAQNSWNARFPGVGIAGYNNTIAGSYDFALQAYLNGNLQASTYMRVNVNGGTTGGATFDGNVPDNASILMLLGCALPLLAVMRRRFVK